MRTLMLILLCCVLCVVCLLPLVDAATPTISPGEAARAKEAAQKAECLSNLHNLALAMLMFAEDHDSHLPKAKAWMDDLTPYLRETKVFHCPADKKKYSYAMNSAVSGKDLADFKDPAKVVMVYEQSSTKRNASGKPPSAKVAGLHAGGRAYAYVDGHVKFESKSRS